MEEPLLCGDPVADCEPRVVAEESVGVLCSGRGELDIGSVEVVPVGTADIDERLVTAGPLPPAPCGAGLSVDAEHGAQAGDPLVQRRRLNHHLVAVVRLNPG